MSQPQIKPHLEGASARQPPSLLNRCATFHFKVFKTLTVANFDRPPCQYPINQTRALELLQTTKPLPKAKAKQPKRRSRVDSISRKEAVAEMPSSCKDIRAALAQCLQESDCIMIQRNTPADCLRPPLLDTMPTKCQQLKIGYGQCKRGMVDMRKRFRGNQPIAVSKEPEGGSSGQTAVGGGQLYAGKSAFGGGVKETSGDEPVERDWREAENEMEKKR